MDYLGASLVLFVHCAVIVSSTHLSQNYNNEAPWMWSSWSQWSSCSTQCGEGVETRTRRCLGWRADASRLRGFSLPCDGYGQMKRLCYGKCDRDPVQPVTDDCFGLNFDYGDTDRDIQLQREWVQVKRGFPCEIVCRSIYNKGMKTIRLKKNGTPCQAYGVSNGECFAGTCQSVEDGCRDSYGRPLKVDMCMKCGGVNSTCQRQEGTFRTIVRNRELSDKPLVVRIPEGSTSIEIVKYGRAINTLALLDSSDRYVINEKGWPSKQGNYKIDGIDWTYSQRIHQESMTSRGPTVAPITIKLTTKHERQVVHYTVWVPNGRSLETQNYFIDDFSYPFNVDVGSQTSNQNSDFTEPRVLKTTPKPFITSNEEDDYTHPQLSKYQPYNKDANIGDSGNKRVPPDLRSSDKSSQLRIESHPSHIRDFDDLIDIENDPAPSVFGVEGAKTIVIQLDNTRESQDESDAKTVQLENDKEPTFLTPSSYDETFDSGEDKEDKEEDENIWGVVESELKRRGEEYIWELVEWQLRLRREEAIWELVEEELSRIGEDAIWELVEEGLRKMHEENGHKKSKHGVARGESSGPNFTSGEDGVEVVLPSGQDADTHAEKGYGKGDNGVQSGRATIITSGENDIDILIPSVKADEDSGFFIEGGRDENIELEPKRPVRGGDKDNNRTRRVNVTLRELLLEDNATSRVRPRGIVKRPKLKRTRRPGNNRPKIKRTRKLGNNRRRPRMKTRRKKTKTKNNGNGRPNDVYISLRPNEHCFPCIRPKDKGRQFCTSDFVSKVHVNRRKVIGNETRYDVTILSSYRNRVRLLQREYIWMESTCRCPRVKTKRTYIVMGKMQNLSDRLTRLVITPKSYIRGFSVGFDRKIRELAKTIRCPPNRNKVGRG